MTSAVVPPTASSFDPVGHKRRFETYSMSDRRVGIWMIGALGGVASTAALGLSALARGLIDTTSLVTATPPFDRLDLDSFGQFVLGGHDIRGGSLIQTASELHRRANVFDEAIIAQCAPDLETWTKNIR